MFSGRNEIRIHLLTGNRNYGAEASFAPVTPIRWMRRAISKPLNRILFTRITTAWYCFWIDRPFSFFPSGGNASCFGEIFVSGNFECLRYKIPVNESLYTQALIITGECYCLMIQYYSKILKKSDFSEFYYFKKYFTGSNLYFSSQKVHSSPKDFSISS